MSPAHLCACLLLYSARSVSAAPRSTLKPITASLSLLLVRVQYSTVQYSTVQYSTVPVVGAGGRLDLVHVQAVQEVNEEVKIHPRTGLTAVINTVHTKRLSLETMMINL